MVYDVMLPKKTEKTEMLIKSCAPKKLLIRELSAEENQVRKYILTEYTRSGTAPLRERIGEQFRDLDVDSILQKLDTLDFIYMSAEKVIECCYPFSSRETAHTVEMGQINVYCMCAIDALGVPFMVGKDVVIHSECGFSGEPLTIRIEEEKIVYRTHRDIWVWGDLDRCGKSADSCCRKIVFFVSDNLDKWLESHPDEKDVGLTLSEAFFMGKYLFEPFLE